MKGFCRSLFGSLPVLCRDPEGLRTILFGILAVDSLDFPFLCLRQEEGVMVEVAQTRFVDSFDVKRRFLLLIYRSFLGRTTARHLVHSPPLFLIWPPCTNNPNGIPSPASASHIEASYDTKERPSPVQEVATGVTKREK